MGAMNIDTVCPIDLSGAEYRTHRHLMQADIFIGGLTFVDGRFSSRRKMGYKAYCDAEIAKTVVQTYLKLFFWGMDARFFRKANSEVEFYVLFTDYNWVQSWEDLRSEKRD